MLPSASSSKSAGRSPAGGAGRAIKVLIASLPLLSGCHGVPPKYEVGDQRLLLIPFRDMSVKPWKNFGDSPRGVGIISYFRSWSETYWSPRISDPRDNESVVKAVREWTKEKFTPADWRQLLAGTDADLVLIGDILNFQEQDPKTVGLYKGTIRGKYSLIKASSGREVYRSIEYTLEYPHLTELDSPMREFSANPKDIERGLLRMFGEQIGKDLFGYSP